MALSLDADRGFLRVERTARSIEHLSSRIEQWVQLRRTDARFARFVVHLDLLRAVLQRMLEVLADHLRARTAGLDDPQAYPCCRTVDAGVVHVQRTFEWYAQKYDQRLDDRLAPVLQAADEVVRSCWAEPFVLTRQPPPPGPLAYLDARFDAMATPRVSPPPDLRAPADSVVAECVQQLPIPTIALPATAVDEPWWLVLAAHETGHHVQRDLADGLVAGSRAAVAVAAGDLADDWSAWSLEVFADAWSVLMVGPHAAWAVQELQHGPPDALVVVPAPGDRYPPPAVRWALLGELARSAGVAGPGCDGAEQVRGWVDGLPAAAVHPKARAAVQQQLAVVPAVAAALVGLTIGERTLGQVSGLRPQWFGAGGRTDLWSGQLAAVAPVLSPLKERPAARIAVSAGVRAAATCADPATRAVVAHNLLGVLPSCGGPGTLAATSVVDVSGLADDLAGRLLEAATRGGPDPGPDSAP
ncbi:MAG TPA: hypothetical protein VFR07_18390 [Mycobacteriales bacterium]|nr:hypothetical protein [Mycobacteriales bacterium]